MTDPWYGTLKHPRHTRRERRMAGILAGLTFVTMTMAGVGHGLDYVTLTGRTGTAFDPLTTGAQFAFCLIGILGTHEYGHYLTAVRNGVRTRLPKFIPAPTFAGTLGAFITIHGMERRRAVFDIAAAGPLVGFAVTVPVLAAGILVSTPVPIEAFDEHEMTRLGTPMLIELDRHPRPRRDRARHGAGVAPRGDGRVARPPHHSPEPHPGRVPRRRPHHALHAPEPHRRPVEERDLP